MSRLNGIWKFYYSKKQLEEKKKLASEISSKLEGFTLEKTYVEIDGELKEYTEAAHVMHTNSDKYTPHEKRFEDSRVVGRVVNPTIKRGRLLLANGGKDAEDCDKKEGSKMKYRKKPVVIEAVQYKDASPACIHEIESFVGGNVTIDKKAVPPLINIHTLEGTMEAKLGDYIIKGVNGEFYPCKPDVFAKTYDPVEEGES